MTPKEQNNLDARLMGAVFAGHTQVLKVLLAAGANVHALDDLALRWAAYYGRIKTVEVLAKHLFAPESWRGKSRAEIEAGATALYDKIKKAYSPSNPITTDRLRTAGTILADSALTCWEQVRPPPPKLTLSPLPAQPRPV